MSTGEIKRKFCSYCGVEIVQEDRKFCNKCGMKINANKAVTEREGLYSKFFCPKCGSEIREDSKFCKRCGFRRDKSSWIIRINKKINLFSVFVGLVVTVLIFILGSLSFGWVIMSKIMNPAFYLYLLLFSMLFVGGLVTAVIGSKNINEGMVNGGFLGLFSLIILGFVFGVIFLILMGITSAIASAFSTIGATTTPTTTTSSMPAITEDNLMIIFEGLKGILWGIVAIMIIPLSGVGGGALGGWIKEV